MIVISGGLIFAYFHLFIFFLGDEEGEGREAIEEEDYDDGEVQLPTELRRLISGGIMGRPPAGLGAHLIRLQQRFQAQSRILHFISSSQPLSFTICLFHSRVYSFHPFHCNLTYFLSDVFYLLFFLVHVFVSSIQVLVETVPRWVLGVPPHHSLWDRDLVQI